MRILLVEDDRTIRITVRDALEDSGHRVVERVDGSQALTTLGQERFDLLLTDVRLPGVDGISLFRRMREVQPDAAVVLMTAYGQVDDAVTVIREGADDYITKPFVMGELVLRIERLHERLRMRDAMAVGRPDSCQSVARQVVGESPAIRQVLDRVGAAASAGVNVLITGETGTGKELCARTLHCRSARADRPFVHVNCAAIPTELFESEIFGHEKGAFTGAVARREGRMGAADGGTLFLDEVGELSSEHQSKLLQAVDSGTFEPVGSSRSVEVDLWIVSATNVDLREEVEKRQFRDDLFFRLNVMEIEMPPLRQRRGDIVLLVADFLREFAQRRKVPLPELSPGAIAALLAYKYPGNIRELFHALEHGLALARGKTIEVRHLPTTLAARLPPGLSDGGDTLSLSDAVRQFETAYVQRVLDQVGGKRSEAAKALGISRTSLWQKLKDDRP
jgi:DNA-binding NtrC family response regulator